jgi:hypothetical protein
MEEQTTQAEARASTLKLHELSDTCDVLLEGGIYKEGQKPVVGWTGFRPALHRPTGRLHTANPDQGTCNPS